MADRGELLDPIFGAPAVDARLGDAAWLQAMLDVEVALAEAGAQVGLVPAAAAAAVRAAAADPARFDVADLGRQSLSAGNPVVPLVRRLGELVAPDARPFVHLGATSQDVLDTATSLVAARALEPLDADLAAIAGRCAELARRHRDTLLAGRTLGQHALPTTFGLICAGWLVAVDEARRELARARALLAVQLGGAAGTLAALGADGVQVVTELAAALGLAEPVLPWHTDRTRVARLAAALGTVCGTLGKIALDVTLHAQTEVGELAEGVGGTSSAMPHKQNPVRSVLVSACARRAPGLVATILAAMPQEQQRATGGWHAEWLPLRDLLATTGGAAGHGRALLAGLRVDTARMRGNLERTDGRLMAESLAGRLAPFLGRSAAQDLTARLAATAAREGAAFRAVVSADDAVRGVLGVDQIDAALDPEHYLGAAAAFIDRALARQQEIPQETE